jgi:hypothetical protein
VVNKSNNKAIALLTACCNYGTFDETKNYQIVNMGIFYNQKSHSFGYGINFYISHMIKNLIFPNKDNKAIWLNALFLLVLLLTNNASPLTIVLAYFLETIIIGILHVYKLIMVVKYGKKDDLESKGSLPGFGVILFFIFHYGFFITVQLILIFSIFFSSVSVKNELLSDVNGLIIVLISILVTNMFYVYNNFIQTKKYKEYSPQSILFKPYLRIFIQQFVVILSGFVIMIFLNGMAPAVILIVLRFLLDVVVVSINNKSKEFDGYVKEKTNSYDHYLELKKKYEEFSE